MDQQLEMPLPTTVAPRRSHGWIPWLIFIAIVAATGAYFYQRPHVEARQPGGRRGAQPTTIGAAAIEKGAIDVTLNALGTVTSLSTVTVKPQVTGPLVHVNFKEGQDVKKGDLLAEIDPRPYQAALAQAQGQLVRDQAMLKDAQLDLVRDQKLVAQGTATPQTLDAQVALVAQDQGSIQVDQAMIQTATLNLDYCRILAPVDGRAGLRQVDEGNYVTPSDANGIVVITQVQPISVLFTVPEDELPAIAQRMRQGATLPTSAFDRAGAKKLADGQLETFDSQIDPSTGTIKLRAGFANEARVLYPNQFVNVALLVDEHKDAAIAPIAAIQRGLPGTFVYLVNPDSTVAVRKVTLGVTNGERVEILAGLNPGDRVVVDGADKLRDGAHVNLQQDGQAPVSPRATAPIPASETPSAQTPAPTPPQAAAPSDGQASDGQTPSGETTNGQTPDGTAHKHQGHKHRRSQSGQPESGQQQ
ncbi:MdtA/MuxA family multidrug efflux RND transporter periplasmic adaptor subunit [Mesorhizobium erdmanii]|uniref:MdtA/MuxA family multidrug efflux RND transporter periplasmic adaptor subunit n=1 Tax=Mesorhizobium erdmanii TaxID=1777866 RepID=A0A6M7UJL9_9HYPH|nr:MULTISPECIES: MdtA/MuxA family multidrug efflux RND transporter periplasmic adaptor subunit [Mesorhizobium]OBQ73629.1 efflux transporter periplasmic adaptor subunit [Mesorhizobium loti]QKC75977.1 MdtA/MuxA family multidrug efflux RND transporter periplasmic adaptor subunit [Mesorhizobium erdmanii]